MWNLICQVPSLFALVDRDDRQQGGGRRDTDLAGGFAIRCRDVDQSFQEPVEGRLPVVDRRLLVVGEWDTGQHALEVFLGLQQLCLAGVFGGIEIATGTSHSVRALLKEAVSAVSVTEVVVLPRLARRRGPGGDGVAIDQ